MLVAILLATPWIRIGGEPLVLLDIPHRKFHVFGLTIFPQELYFLWLIVVGLAFALFFFTALAGRLWCGWACPQTVLTDVFAMIARRIQGWTPGGGPPRRIATWRLVSTQLVWVVLALFIGFHLVGYFRSPYEMLGALRAGELSGASMGFWAAASTLTYLDIGLLRQTFCKFLCPYARFQGVLFDSDTLVVAYDSGRGEPRGKKGRVEGDCVNCGLCVDVCPTGIDIREGLQMECIACTQCIDACNGVMARVGREKDLIAYRSLRALEGRGPARVLRPRVVAYGVLLLAVSIAFGTALATRKPLEMLVERNRSALYQVMGDGRIGNAFTLHLENRDNTNRVFRLRVEPHDRYDLYSGLNPLLISAASTLESRVFVVARDGASNETLTFVLEELEHPDRRIERTSRFFMPAGSTGGAR